MEVQRPRPEILLQEIQKDESNKGRGKLKIFFGYAAGVGKTYAMLEAAHAALKDGVDVVVGYVEPHQRPQTMALLDGLPQIPTLPISHGGITLREFDIDSALKRAPQLILVDELAHTNAKGSRHVKRYQDVEELLRMGIDVYSTVNVQHIESLNDIVESITGIAVRERIPDSVFDSADKVELVDIEPEDLIQRLNSGKVYRNEQVQKALQHFFTRENLVALREIALRRTADRVNLTVEKNKILANRTEYYTEEHILICLSSASTNGKVVRTAARMAEAFHGSLTALLVETSESQDFSEEKLRQIKDNTHLAEQLGAKIVTVYGDDLVYQISEYAKASGTSKFVAGRSRNNKILGLGPQNDTDKLLSFAPNLDIYVIPTKDSNYQSKRRKKFKIPVFSIRDTLIMFLFLAIPTVIGFLFYQLGFSESNIITVYILCTLFTAVVTKGKVYSLVSSILAVLLFNFFFTQPRFSLQAYNPGYPLTFLVMFLSAFITSTFTKRVKDQARQASLKSYRTEVLLETSLKLQYAKSKTDLYRECANQIMKLLDRTVILYPVVDDRLEAPLVMAIQEEPTSAYLTADEFAVAQWVYRNNKHAGATTNTLPGAKCLYMAIRSSESVFAVVGVAIDNQETLAAFEKNLLIAMLAECALALERGNILEKNHQIQLEAKQEQLRSNLLRAISHDLKTPLTSISGNASVLMESAAELSVEQKQNLYSYIYDDSMWLINLIENILSITRIDNGSLHIHKEPELLKEIIREALRHVSRKSKEHILQVHVDNDMLLVNVDSRLIVQVIINIVDNAVKYTQTGSTIKIEAKEKNGMAFISIEDDGDGISEVSKAKLFDMFFTVENSVGDSRRGLGLGLALCKSIVNAHGGTIWVEDVEPHGTRFCFTLEMVK